MSALSKRIRFESCMPLVNGQWMTSMTRCSMLRQTFSRRRHETSQSRQVTSAGLGIKIN